MEIELPRNCIVFFSSVGVLLLELIFAGRFSEFEIYRNLYVTVWPLHFKKQNPILEVVKNHHMAVEVLEEKKLNYLLKAVANLVKLPKTQMWLDYDAGADVLYLHFEEKPASTHSKMREDGIVLDYRNNRLVGITVLEASHR